MACPYRLSKDGIESQFATNHMGHYCLTQTLLPRIIESQPSRIVNVSSALHEAAKNGIDFDKINDQKSYDPWRQYGKISASLISVDANNCRN